MPLEACMRCGAQAATRGRKTFKWAPPWTLALLPLGVIPYFLIGLIVTKSCKIPVPLCASHRNHWNWRLWAVVGLFAVTVLTTIGYPFAVAAMAGSNKAQANALFGLWCPACLTTVVLCFTAFVVLQFTAIRPVQITDRDVTMTNVSPEYAQAVEDHSVRAPRPHRADKDREKPRVEARRRSRNKDENQPPSDDRALPL